MLDVNHSPTVKRALLMLDEHATLIGFDDLAKTYLGMEGWSTPRTLDSPWALLGTDQQPVGAAVCEARWLVDGRDHQRRWPVEAVPAQVLQGAGWLVWVSLEGIEGQYQQLSRQKRLETLLEGTQAGTWEWNVQTGETVFNERWAAILGYRLQDLAPISIGTWERLTHPDDLARSKAELQAHFRGDTAFYECEARMRHRQGHWVWLRDYGKVATRTPNGDPEWISGTHIDISAHKEALHQLYQSYQQLDTITQSLPGMVYQFEITADGTTRFPYASQGIEAIYGIGVDALQRDAGAILKRLHPLDRQRVINSILESAETLGMWICEYRVVWGGQSRWLHGQARPERLDSGTVRWHGFISDITQRKILESELNWHKHLLEESQRIARLGHWEVNLESGDVIWSPIIFDILGLDPQSTRPSVELFHSMVHPEDLSQVMDREYRVRKTGVYNVEHRIVRPDGRIRWVHEIAEIRQTESGSLSLIGTAVDITRRKRLEIRLRQQSITDELTRISNRRHFVKKTKQEMARHRGSNRPLTLLAFDFDHFKSINDRYGHAAGDQVLVAACEAIGQRLRISDHFARIGGEEFAILLPETDMEGARFIAESIRQRVSELCISCEGAELKPTISIGIAQLNEDDQHHDALFIRADQAMYQAKQQGRNQVKVDAVTM